MSIPILKIFTLFLRFSDVAEHCSALLANLTRIPLCISKKNATTRPQTENSIGKFVSNPSIDKNRSTGQGKQIKMSILPVALNAVLFEKVGKLSKQTSVVADFRQ